MRELTPIIARQLHEWFPDAKITSTRFIGNYEYGQFYIGEVDRDVIKELTDHHQVIRDVMIIYSVDPTKNQRDAMAELNRVSGIIQDYCCHVIPRWHRPYFDIYQGTMLITFEIWERYTYTNSSVEKLGSIDIKY